jgi:hypothetical protein
MTRVVCPCCKGHKMLESYDPSGGAPYIDICTHCMGIGKVDMRYDRHEDRHEKRHARHDRHEASRADDSR